MTCTCHPWCRICSEHLVPAEGRACRHCLIEMRLSEGELSATQANAEHAALEATEAHETACPECEGGPCGGELCDSCEGEEAVAQAEHERSHGPGSL